MVIERARLRDLPQILYLQKTAYQSEAELVNDFTIPPLTQTIENLIEDFNKGIILKAYEKDNPEIIIGSVRGYMEMDTIYIEKLIVKPEFQNQGIGSSLLSSIESLYSASRCELYTSDKSIKNRFLYAKRGYEEFKEEKVNDEYKMIYMQKFMR